MSAPTTFPPRGVFSHFRDSNLRLAIVHIQLPGGKTAFFAENWFVKQDFYVGGKVKFKISNDYYRNELKNGYMIPDVDAEYEIVKIEPSSQF